MTDQGELDAMPPKPIECHLSGSINLDRAVFGDLEVDEEIKVTGTYIVRKVGLQHIKGESPGPFATAQFDRGTAKRT